MTGLQRRLARAGLVATALALIFATHVFTSFQPTRVRLVRPSLHAAGGAIRIVTSGADVNDLRVPFAVIWRVRNDAPASVRLGLTIDGHAICTEDVRPGASTRLDCAMRTDWLPTGNHEVAIVGSSAAWDLDYLELATHHGGSRGRALVILPAGSTAFERPSVVLAGAVWLLLAGLLLVPAHAARPTVLRLVQVAAAAAILIVLAAALISTAFVPYTLVLSSSGFFESVCVLFAWRLVTAALWLGRAVRRRVTEESVAYGRKAWRLLAPPVGVGLIVLLAYGGVMFRRLHDFYGGNYSGLLQISRQLFEDNPLLRTRHDVKDTLVLGEGGGYDGQFMYFMAFDPFMRVFRSHVHLYRSVVDAPPYRFGRIGFSLLTNVVSLGHWEWYPAVMMWMILLSTSAGAVALAAIARQQGASPAWGATILFVPGFWQSLQTGLPEPIAAALMLWGIFCVLTERWLAAGLVMALSLLVRETGGVFVTFLALAALLAGKRRQALLMFVIAVIPLALWRLYVGATLYPDFGLQGYWFDPHDLTLPFGGFVDLWRRVSAGAYFAGDPDMVRSAMTYPVLLTFAAALALAALIRRPGPITIAGVVYAVLAISLNYPAIWVHVGNGQRGTFEVFIALALSTWSLRSPGWLRWSRNLFWAASAGYVFFGAFDAPYVRSAILSWFGIFAY